MRPGACPAAKAIEAYSGVHTNPYAPDGACRAGLLRPRYQSVYASMTTEPAAAAAATATAAAYRFPAGRRDGAEVLTGQPREAMLPFARLPSPNHLPTRRKQPPPSGIGSPRTGAHRRPASGPLPRPLRRDRPPTWQRAAKGMDESAKSTTDRVTAARCGGPGPTEAVRTSTPGTSSERRLLAREPARRGWPREAPAAAPRCRWPAGARCR